MWSDELGLRICFLKSDKAEGTLGLESDKARLESSKRLNQIWSLIIDALRFEREQQTTTPHGVA